MYHLFVECCVWCEVEMFFNGWPAVLGCGALYVGLLLGFLSWCWSVSKFWHRCHSVVTIIAL